MNGITPYEGTQPYIFISYAHADAPAVMAIGARLQAAGCRVWYDGGIEVGSEWPEYIAAHLAGAAVMLAFLSKAYIRSDNCRKEMHFAQTRKIRTVNIFLEETALTPGMEMQIGSLFALMKYTMPEDVFYEKLFAAPQLAPLLAEGAACEPFQPSASSAKKKKSWPWQRIVLLCVSSVLLVTLVTLGIVGWSTGIAQRIYIEKTQPAITVPPYNTPAVFTSAALEKAARDYAAKPDGPLMVGDLAELYELCLESPEPGALSELRFFPNLSSLRLIGYEADNLKALPVCGLESLSLVDCRIRSLRGVGNLPLLRVLDCEGCPIRSLGNLSRCLELRRLNLGSANVNSFAALVPLRELAEAEIANAALDDLWPLLAQNELSDLVFTDCDLRGRFFKRFDREWNIVSLTLVDCELNSTVNLEDFTSLRELTLIRSGEKLDWSALAGLPSLRVVTADKSMEAVLREALAGTETTVKLNILEQEAAA